MKINKKTRWLALAMLVLALIICSIVWFDRGKKDDKVTIGVIFPGAISESGWNGTHYAGVKQACDELGAELLVYENVPEYSGKCKEAVQELAKRKAGAIILESFNYPEEIKDTIDAYPEIDFFCCSFAHGDRNYTPYFARVYQARYLSGVVAGLRTTTNHIGYVAAMDNSEVNRGLNSFALGVRSVNPEAVIHVTYTGAWDDREKEMSETRAIVEKCNADVIAYHQNQPFVVEAAVELGVDVIGYNVGQVSNSSHLLTSVISNWDMVYREIIRDHMSGREMDGKIYWLGIEKDAVSLAFYSDLVSQEIRDTVAYTKEQLIQSREVFFGPIYDNNGVMRCNENEVIRDEILLGEMDWLVEGVEVYEEKE